MQIISTSPQDSPGHAIAAIDLGSNSFHLAIAKVIGDKIHITKKTREKTQLASFLDEGDKLNDYGMARALACLNEFKQEIDAANVGHINAVGTNTMRVASNGKILAEKIGKILNTDLKIISGEEEARLIYKGATCEKLFNQKSLIIDIGGGSTELVLGKKGSIDELVSLPLGCVVFANKHFTKTTALANAFEASYNEARDIISSHAKSFVNLGWDVCAGCSGTVAAVFDVMGHSLKLGEKVTSNNLREIREILLREGVEKVFGLRKDRLDVFPSGLSILCALFDELGIESMVNSKGALREGLLIELAESLS